MNQTLMAVLLSRPYVASSGGLLGQPAWRGGQTPVVRGEERKAGRDGVVAQDGDHRPGPQPGGLVGNPPAVVEPVVVDAVQQVAVDDALPVLDEPAGRAEPGQVCARALEAGDQPVIRLDALPAVE